MKNALFRNPWIRTLLPLSLLTIASVTANTLVVEIAKDDTINWLAIPQKTSFYILLVATILTAIYQVLLFNFDNTLMKSFLTPKQYEAALRKEVLEETANRAKKLIQEGNFEEFEKWTMKFQRLFGEGEK